MIEKEAELNEIVSTAKEGNDFVDIFDTTVTKVKQGITTVEEAIRVLGHLM